VEFVEDGAGAVFDVGGGEDGDAVWWEGGGEGGAAVEVFEGGDIGCYCVIVLVGGVVDGDLVVVVHSPALSRWGWVSWRGCPKCSTAVAKLLLVA